MNWTAFFNRTWIGENTIADWCWFAGILLFGLLFHILFARLLTRIIYRFFHKKEKENIGFDSMFVLLRRPWAVFLLLLTFYIACQQLHFPLSWKMAAADKFGIRMVLERSFDTVLIISFTWILLRLADFFGLLLIHRAAQTESKHDDQLIPFFRESIKVIIVILSFFFVLGAVFHINIASLIAGLGIGGLAVALAAKESIENLLASFTIFLDKPFSVGDQVQVEKVSGTVERIGFRSTRIRTEEKSYVTVPNKKMVDNEVNNLSLRPLRRVSQTIYLTHNAPPEKLKAFTADLQTLLDQHPEIDESESRVRLYNLSQTSIDVLLIYFIKNLEYDSFINIRQEVNYKVIELVEKHGLVFASTATPATTEKK
jgi:MscS family membrane protein